MRGSTRIRRSQFRRRQGSPAQAGIDPVQPADRIGYGRLPRACEDRPAIVDARTGDCKAPPRVRGETRGDLSYDMIEKGSPAHAGIDPVGSSMRRAIPGLPRACGDRLFHSSAAAPALPAPPRMTLPPESGSHNEMHNFIYGGVMGKTNRARYTLEFKLEALRLVGAGRSVSAMAETPRIIPASRRRRAPSPQSPLRNSQIVRSPTR